MHWLITFNKVGGGSVVVASLLIVRPIVSFCIFYVLLCITLCLFMFCNNLDGEEIAGCFAKFVFLVSRYCCLALPRGATGLSAVCDCGICFSAACSALLLFAPWNVW